jgi:hypothetical protein
MASKDNHSPKQSAQGSKAPKGRGELESKDLDKVTGGRPGTIGNIREPKTGG